MGGAPLLIHVVDTRCEKLGFVQCRKVLQQFTGLTFFGSSLSHESDCYCWACNMFWTSQRPHHWNCKCTREKTFGRSVKKNEQLRVIFQVLLQNIIIPTKTICEGLLCCCCSGFFRCFPPVGCAVEELGRGRAMTLFWLYTNQNLN